MCPFKPKKIHFLLQGQQLHRGTEPKVFHSISFLHRYFFIHVTNSTYLTCKHRSNLDNFIKCGKIHFTKANNELLMSPQCQC